MSKTKIKNIRLDEQSNFKRENACRRITKCLLKVQSKTKETGPFFRDVVSLRFPGGNYFVLSRNATAIKGKCFVGY